MKQIIIARKDLGMSPGKLGAQCSHAAMMFLTQNIKANLEKVPGLDLYRTSFTLQGAVVDGWLLGIFTKIVLEARDRAHLYKAIGYAEGLGLKEDRDFFVVKDNCLTELGPEEIGEDGVGRTATCIGFRPLPDDVARKISKHYQLFRG